MPDAEVHYLPSEEADALAAARYLAECGVPIFLAQPALDSDGAWIPDGGKSGTGYHLPGGWQRTEADPAVVDRWKPGMALCAVMGHVVDGVDLDPRSGSDESAKVLPAFRSYGRAITPSGGTHDFVATLGVRSRDGLLPGVDLKAGIAGEGGHGFLFLAPTVKLSKATGEVGAYKWDLKPNLDELLLVGADDTGAGLRELVGRRGADGEVAVVRYHGPRYGELPEGLRAWADEDLAGVVDYWRSLLEEAEGWPEGVRDAHGRGWDVLARDCAWALARVAATPWSPLEMDQAAALFTELLPAGMQETRFTGKWDDDLIDKALAVAEVPVPPWDGLSVEKRRETVEVGNFARAEFWLYQELGMEGTPLAGLFLLDGRIVHTPLVGEDGYVPLSGRLGDLDGPAQVRRAGEDYIRSRVQHGYHVVRKLKGGATQPVLFPGDAVGVAVGDPYSLPNLRALVGVTHTPMLRADGSVLDREGYDALSGRLFIPERGLVVGSVPERPTGADVREARALLDLMLGDFPWNTPHDLANYLCLLLTPLVRELVGPPYKLGVINAHQRGSGKSLLGWILRELHGGVLRGDVPRDGEEFRKQITTVLTGTTAPVVQWDNVRRLGDNNLDALLTSEVWSDRALGSNSNLTARNDRLWLATGNNVVLGGDLVRRVLWVSIDPQDPHPEARTDFAVTDLKAWVRERRGELLRALLVLARGWVCGGRKVAGGRVGEDDYARWIEVCRGVVAYGGWPGVVGHRDTVRQDDSDDDAEWREFLEAVRERFGDEPFTTAELTEALAFMDVGVPQGMGTGSAVSVGRWLANRQGQWAGELCVRLAGVNAESKVKKWTVRGV